MWREETENVVRDYPSVTFMSGGIGNIEIIRRGVGKGTALLRLGERLGVAAEEIMAVGDSENDLDMIAKPAWAWPWPTASAPCLDCADYVTASNDEDGAAAASSASP